MSERAWSEDRATMFLVLAVMVVAGACGGRTLSGGGETSSGESGSAEGSDPEELLACEGPNAPTGPVELVGGQMQPESFVRVGKRIYWADGWDEWTDELPSTTLYRAEAAADGPWIPVALEQPGVNQIVADDEAVYWVVEGVPMQGGELLRATFEDEIQPLDAGLLSPRALALGDANEWLYYVEGGNLDEPDAKVLRIRPDGSSKQVIAEGLGTIEDLAVDELHVWWVSPITDGVWRVAKDGGGQELIAEAPFPNQIEVHDGVGWTIGLIGLHRIAVGEEPYFVTGHHGPYELAVDSSHAYVTWWNQFEEPHLGWIARYPLSNGEIDSFDGESVISNSSPRPTAVRVDEQAIYWATADEESGEGAIWMLCKSNL